MICLTRINLPKSSKTILLADGTASLELLQQAVGQEIKDITPEGRLALAHQVVQYPIDITRRASLSRVQEIVRGILLSRPECRRVGVITHSTMTAALLNLGIFFDPRIVWITHFGSGQDRGSNACLETQCDLLIVIGTPRVSSIEVQKRLHQCNQLASLQSLGDWGPLPWSGFTITNRRRVVHGRGYRDPVWREAQRSIVRATLIQAVGRARPLLPAGCGCILLTTEETGFPLADIGQDLVRVTESESRIVCALSALAPLEDSPTTMYLRSKGACATSAQLSQQCQLSLRQTQKLLHRLEQLRVVYRLGERSGWSLRRHNRDSESASSEYADADCPDG